MTGITRDATAAAAFAAGQERAKSSDRSTWLGSLLWYTVSETSVRHADLKTALEGAGLAGLVPRSPRSEDVFRRVAPNGHKKRLSTSNDQIHLNYLIRQVRRGGGSCVKHIVVETVDASGDCLEYEEVYELAYDGTKDELVTRPLGAGDAVAQEIAQDVARRFRATVGMVDAAAVRKIIRGAMEQARATNVRPTGGVYFVMQRYVHIVDALEQFASVIPECTVHPMPLIDDTKQRDMLRRAYEAETIEEVERSMQDISEMLASNDPVSPDQYARLSQRFVALMTRNAEYVDLLQDTLDGTASKLDIYQRQMAQLLTKVS